MCGLCGQTGLSKITKQSHKHLDPMNLPNKCLFSPSSPPVKFFPWVQKETNSLCFFVKFFYFHVMWKRSPHFFEATAHQCLKGPASLTLWDYTKFLTHDLTHLWSPTHTALKPDTSGTSGLFSATHLRVEQNIPHKARKPFPVFPAPGSHRPMNESNSKQGTPGQKKKKKLYEKIIVEAQDTP